jgi:hypothetical protein
MPVTFTVLATGHTYPATVDNMSLGGVLLLTEERIAEGTRIVINLPIAEDMTMRVAASLVRTTNVGEVGVAFVSLSEDELDRLADFVEHRAGAGADGE